MTARATHPYDGRRTCRCGSTDGLKSGPWGFVCAECDRISRQVLQGVPLRRIAPHLLTSSRGTSK